MEHGQRRTERWLRRRLLLALLLALLLQLLLLLRVLARSGRYTAPLSAELCRTGLWRRRRW